MDLLLKFTFSYLQSGIVTTLLNQLCLHANTHTQQCLSQKLSYKFAFCLTTITNVKNVKRGSKLLATSFATFD